VEFPFGVLPWPDHARGHRWSLEILDDYRETISEWQSRGSDHDWVYPPCHPSRRWVRDPATGSETWVRVPGSERALPVWNVPVTHKLVYTGPGVPDQELTKEGIATFLIYLIGRVNGVEVQHEDWYVAGRQHKDIGGVFVPVGHALDQLMGHAERWFEALKPAVRTAAISALYLHNHVLSYEFSWEAFAWQFSVFDACCYIADKTGIVQNSMRGMGHGKRFEELARIGGLVSRPAAFIQWVKYRNALIHEVTWGKAVPGHHPERGVYDALWDLRYYTTFALLVALKYRSPSLAQDWQVRERLALEPMR
jgi:hypothetical protein